MVSLDRNRLLSVFVFFCINVHQTNPTNERLIRQKRNAISNVNKLWTTRIIPFVFSPSLKLTYTSRTTLRAMANIERKTCLKFKPRTNEVDYLYFDRSAQHRPCWSNVGRSGGKQALGFHSVCNFRDISHELLHALGFEHEHQRPDRDEYIKIDWDYVKKGMETNFETLSASKVDTLQTPYDFKSIMHYRALDGSKDNRHPTILLKNGKRGTFSGDILTPIDIWKINNHYRCNEKKCQHPGTPENGILYAHGTNVGETVSYECNPGHTRVGSPHRTCEFNSETRRFQWSGETPKCRENVLMYCDFESTDICAWKKGRRSKVDWIRFSGRALTKNTGPENDNTIKTHAGYYMLLDSTDGQQGDTAILNSIKMAAGSDLDLSFYLHMKCEKACGELEVNLREQGNRFKQLYYTNRNLGDQWKRVNIHFKYANIFWLEFKATRGGDNWGDIAIDDVLVAHHQQDLLHDAVVVTPTATPPPILGNESYTAGCDFNENNLCNFVASTGRLEWKAVTDAKDPDHSKYAVASKNVKKEQKARMTLAIPETHRGVAPICISFVYNFLDVGDDFDRINGDLQVWLKDRNRTYRIWNSHYRGFKEGKWFEKVIEVSMSSNFQITFEAILRPRSVKGIAVDDIEVRDGPCKLDVTEESLLEGLSKFNCTFDEDSCGWEIDFDSDIGWLMTSWETDMPGTGPDADHTTGDERESMFLYLPALDGKKGDMGRVISPTLSFNKRGYCFTFWYHMYGSDMGKLTVRCRPVSHAPPWEQSQNQNYGDELWSKAGNQRNTWRKKSIFLKPNDEFQIVFEGTIGNGRKGDMAFDDVSIILGQC